MNVWLGAETEHALRDQFRYKGELTGTVSSCFRAVDARTAEIVGYRQRAEVLTQLRVPVEFWREVSLIARLRGCSVAKLVHSVIRAKLSGAH